MSCFDGRYTEENNGLIRWGFHIERSKNEKGFVTLPASAKRSEVAAWMNFSMKSRMVNHNAVKVGSVASGVKCYQVKIVSVKRQLDSSGCKNFSFNYHEDGQK